MESDVSTGGYVMAWLALSVLFGLVGWMFSYVVGWAIEAIADLFGWED